MISILSMHQKEVTVKLDRHRFECIVDGKVASTQKIQGKEKGPLRLAFTGFGGKYMMLQIIIESVYEVIIDNFYIW